MKESGAFEAAGQFCGECGCNNLLVATRCEVCGAELRGLPAGPETEGDEALLDDAAASSSEPLDAIPYEQRESLGLFPADHAADLAAGLLRSKGIAVEIAPPMPYGVRTTELWTRQGSAIEARRILAEVERGPGD